MEAVGQRSHSTVTVLRESSVYFENRTVWISGTERKAHMVGFWAVGVQFEWLDMRKNSTEHDEISSGRRARAGTARERMLNSSLDY
jgi:hypothetical protein